MAKTNFELLDVRSINKREEELFGIIMEAKARLQPGQGLRLIAPFEPAPLYAMFEAEGFSVRARQVGDEEWRIDFCPADGSGSEGALPDTIELDLRSLEPPVPLQKSLEALRRLGHRETLVLHTRFRPVHLFEQIEDGGFDYDCEETARNHWTIRLWRADET